MKFKVTRERDLRVWNARFMCVSLGAAKHSQLSGGVLGFYIYASQASTFLTPY